MSWIARHTLAATVLASAAIGGGAIEVGDRAPEFALPSVSGPTYRLAEITPQHTVVLVFYRAFW